MSEERETAAAVLRGVAGGVEAAGGLSGNPAAGGVTKVVGTLLELVASLVEKIGKDKAEEVLRDLAANPAKPITDEDLAAQVAAIKRELAGGDGDDA